MKSEVIRRCVCVCKSVNPKKDTLKEHILLLLSVPEDRDHKWKREVCWKWLTRTNEAVSPPPNESRS